MADHRDEVELAKEAAAAHKHLRLPDEQDPESKQAGKRHGGELIARLGRGVGQPSPTAEFTRRHKLKNRRVFQEKSLCCLRQTNPIRAFCIRVAQNPWFDRIIVFIIILNCLTLAIMDPLDKKDESWRNIIVEKSGDYFTGAFTIEMMVKIIALGFVGKGAYLADGWNCMDFFVVAIAYVSLLPGVSNVSALRTFRVLRPLRTLSTIPEMAVIVNSMLASIPALFNVFLLCVFIFFIFGIVGLQLWSGVLRGRCAYTSPITNLQVVEEDIFCALPCASGDTCSATFGDDCGLADVPVFNGTHWNVLATQMSCVLADNPQFGLVSFDNIGAACLTIFTSITLEGWVDVMYGLNATWGVDVFTAVYFVLLIMFGSFFLLNLALAVIWDEYVKANEALEAEEAEKEEAEERAAELKAQESARELAAADADAGAGAPSQHHPDAAAGTALSPSTAGDGSDVAVDLPRDQAEGNGGKQPPGFLGGCCYRDKHHGYLYYLVESPAFNTFIVMLILLNTATLACEHYDMSTTFEDVLNAMNLTFTIAFGCEMLLKLLGLGVCGYLASSWNRFDGVIVILSFLEIALEVLEVDGGGGGGLSALRTLRLMRVFRLARSWDDLRILLVTIVKSIGDVAHASVVLLIVMFIFCLLGMQLFGGEMEAGEFPDGKPRAHFDTLWWSFVTVFQVLTGENWNEVLYDTVHSVGPIAIAFFLLLNVVGNYLILNLFLAILLGNFDSEDDDEEEEETEEAEEAKAAEQAKLAGATVTPAALEDGPAGRQSTAAAGAAGGSNAVMPLPLDRASSPLSDVPGVKPAAAAGGSSSNKYLLEHGDRKEASSSSGEGGDDGVLVNMSMEPGRGGADAAAGNAAAQAWGGDSVTAGAAAEGGEEGAGKGGDAQEGASSGSSGSSGGGKKKKLVLGKSSLCCLSATNPLRLFCARVVKHRFFDPFILLLIGVSTVLLAMDEPRVSVCKQLPESDPANCVAFAEFLDTADTVITILFVAEMVLKIVTLGFFAGPGHYLRNGWNVLDFIIVVVSLVSMGLGGSTELKALRSLRALRALRPLRVVSRYPGLRLVVNSIFGALPKVRNVMLVNLLFMLIFAIVGVQNWMGALNACNDPAMTTRAQCTGDFLATGELCGYLPFEADQLACRNGNGTMFPRRWQPPPQHFDNTGNALLTVFEVAAGEMWPDIMYKSVDSVGLDQPLARDNSPVSAAYFILINIVCAFFMLEIFTGVVIDNFNKMKEASEGAALLTHKQQMWVETMKMMIGTQPIRRMKRPSGFGARARAPFYSLSNWKFFEVFIMAAILINTLIMALRHYDQGPDWDFALDLLNYVFAGLFAVEAVIKLLGYGVKQYFSVGWNRFDFVLVLLSFLGEAVDLGQLATLLRIVRVARVFRLIKSSRGLQTMFKTLLISFPQLLNVGAVLLLVFFIYAVVGMNLFSDIKYGQHLNEDANFGSFFTTMITLFRMSTGESFNGLMHDCMIQPPYCDPDVNCGFQGFAPIYYVSFYVLSAFILLNLLIAIILDNFMDTVALDEGRKGFVLSDTDMNAFQEVWSRFDPTASGFIPASKMVNVVLELEYPLGLKNTPGVTLDTTLRKQARITLLDMDIPEHEGRVVFLEVLRALASKACGPIVVPGGVPIVNQLEKQHNRILSAKAKLKGANGVHEHMAADMMQSAFLGKKQPGQLEKALSNRQLLPSPTLSRSGSDRAAALPAGASRQAAGALPGAAAGASGAGQGVEEEEDSNKVMEVDPDTDDLGDANAGSLPRPPSSRGRTGTDGQSPQPSEELPGSPELAHPGVVL